MAEQSLVHLQLATLPAELLLWLYEVLPSFPDALRLRATCHALNSVWKHHRSAIVDELVINQLECYPYARQLLADQRDGPPKDQRELSDRDLFKLTRNARRVEEYIRYIEQNFIPGLQMERVLDGEGSNIYGGNETHPPTLTHTERLRVIRASYQIWGLTYCFNESILRKKILSLRPRELFYFIELVDLARHANFPTEDNWETFQIIKATRAALLRLYFGTYRCQPPMFRDFQYDRDRVRLFVIWDHWQENLKNIICRKPLGEMQWDSEAQLLEHLWDYERGDEFLIKEN